MKYKASVELHYFNTAQNTEKKGESEIDSFHNSS